MTKYSLFDIWDFDDDYIDDYLRDLGQNESNYDMKRVILAHDFDRRNLLEDDDLKILKNPNFIKMLMSKSLEETMYYLKLKIITDDFIIIRNLGQGHFGTTYLAKKRYQDNNNLFVLKEQNENSEYLHQEIEILSLLKRNCGTYIICYDRHNNYYNLLGKEKMYIITDYSDKFIGLDVYILQNIFCYKSIYLKDQQLNNLIDEYILIFTNLCKGLQLIHNVDVVHRDIKSANLLINPQNFDIKYIDFGLSIYRPRIDQKINQKNIGDVEYIDPSLSLKSYRSFEDYKQADLFSIGVVIFECLVGITHYKDLKNIIEKFDIMYNDEDENLNQDSLIDEYGLNSYDLFRKCYDWGLQDVDEGFQRVYNKEYDINEYFFQTPFSTTAMKSISQINQRIKEINIISEIQLDVLMSRDTIDRKIFC